MDSVSTQITKQDNTIDIFLSIGKISTQKQEVFVSALETFFRSQGLNPRTVGRTDFSSQQPLKFIEEVMKSCAGTVVIAFERLFIESGVERRNSDSAQTIEQQKLPSVWNQIEAGMAYVLGHPLLVIKENGLKPEGILEFGYDWYVQNADLDPMLLESKLFKGIFIDWKKRLIENVNKI